MNWKSFKTPTALHFYFLFLLIALMTLIEYKMNVDKEFMLLSITVISATAGYFITHFLENERKKMEEKYKLYKDLISDLRVFMKSGEDINPSEDLRKFEDTYYAAWLYISTLVYEKLIDYIEQYKIWAREQTEKNKEDLNDKLILLMQAIRDEVTIDKKAEFTNYILQIKK